MKFVYTPANIVNGGLVFAAGDSIAAWLQDGLDWKRALGMLILGATFYAFEIPNWFRWIEKKTSALEGAKLSLAKMGLAMVYFNPLWIARHLFLIMLFSGRFSEASPDLLRVASLSFLANIPISIVANFLIQNVVPLRWRFLFSSLFSAAMAVYYALSATWFS